MAYSKYRMTMNLNILNHLGIKLYSNIPAVISEVVANSWDADAKKVDITIESDRIEIKDDGCGMDEDDINQKYLNVGYQRRMKEPSITPVYHRQVMGRKGIGKLSLFSIANIIEVHSVKGKTKNGCILSAAKIEKLINSDKKDIEYHPDEISLSDINQKVQGTKIILKDLKKRANRAANALKKRMARRFCIIGIDNNFQVAINGEPIKITDRDYFHKLQYIWVYGSEKDKTLYVQYCNNEKLLHSSVRSGKIAGTEIETEVKGWIGSVAHAGELRDGDDNLNKIVIMVRGKLAQEDILEDFPEGGLYTKYLIGEIYADFLDTDDEDDIATSNRQEIIKDDPRYLALKNWIENELKHIQGKWTDYRNEIGTEKALEIPAINNWFKELTPANQKKAKSLFGKINQLTVDSDKDRKELIKHGVLAFESLKYKKNLEALDRISPENIAEFTEVFVDFDDIEATMYHQIVQERIAVIKALHEKTEINTREKLLQEHLYTHLWLLDPSWERATGTEYMEQRVSKEFHKIDAKLTHDEKKGRLDIKYKTTTGKHIIIELKRAERVCSTEELLPQIRKYRTGLQKILDLLEKKEPIEIVIVVGRELSDWTTPSERKTSEETLKPQNARVITYQSLIENAYRGYQEFLEKNKDAGKIFRLIKDIEEQDFVVQGT